MVATLEESFSTALDVAKKDNLTSIVFSPGAKSFDLFDNVYHRMAAFEKIVEESKKMNIGLV